MPTIHKRGMDYVRESDAPAEAIDKAFGRISKAVVGATIANPALTILYIEKFANWLMLDRRTSIS